MNNIKQDFTIKDLENISGIKAHTIRIWEKRYNLLEPKRTDTNIRLYSNENLQKLLNVVLLNKNGFKISRIAKMMEEEIILQARDIALNNAYINDAINNLKLSMFQFDAALFNKVYEKLLAQTSFKELFKDVFIPFLDQIGLLWQTATLTPAHEHFITNLIAQKIHLNIEKIQYITPKSSTTYVLFLPENEIHELGLLYLNYELILRGNSTVYLGQSLPLSSLEYFLASNNKICFITSLTVRPYDDKIEAYFEEINKTIKKNNHTFIATGRKVEKVKHLKLNTKIELFESITSLLKVI